MVMTAGYPLEADGAVPQTAAIPFVTRRYSSGPLNVATHSPEDSHGDRKCRSAPPADQTEGIVSIQIGGSARVLCGHVYHSRAVFGRHDLWSCLSTVIGQLGYIRRDRSGGWRLVEVQAALQGYAVSPHGHLRLSLPVLQSGFVTWRLSDPRGQESLLPWSRDLTTARLPVREVCRRCHTGRPGLLQDRPLRRAWRRRG